MKYFRLSTLLILCSCAVSWTLLPSEAVAQPGCYDSSTVSFTYASGTTPFSTRAQLDAAELALARADMPALALVSLPPQTKQDADTVRAIREAYWDSRCDRKVRKLEFVISEGAIQNFNNNQAFFGTNIRDYLRAHVAWLNKMALESQGKLDAFWVLDRVMVVTDNVVQGAQPGQCDTIVNHGWQVCNNKSYSWWANDRLNGIEGDIPYDIDSRWVLTDDWAQALPGWAVRKMDPITGNYLRMDFALIHELKHHLCIGDIYWYNPGRFSTPITGTSRRLQFDVAHVNQNNNFYNASASNLTLMEEGASQYCTAKNPKLKRGWQDGIGFLFSGDSTMPAEGYVDPYTASQSTASIRVSYHGWAGSVEGCYFGKGVDVGGVNRIQPITSFPASHTSSYCQVNLSGNYMDEAYPVSYMVLKVNSSGTRFELPMVIQRPLLNHLKWSNDSDRRLSISLTNHFGYTLSQLRNKINSTGSSVVSITAPYQVKVEQGQEITQMVDPLKVFAQADLYGSVSDVIWGLPFESNPQLETCDGRDNDFDGQVDENNVCDCRTWSSYEICEEKVEWEEARTACKAKRKEMLVFDSSWDNTVFGTYYPYFLTHWNYWVGTTDQLNEGQWRNLNGKAPKPTHWAANEPNGGTNENCVSLSGPLKWNDLSCGWENSFICE